MSQIKDKAKLSFVVPTLNRGAFVLRAVDSALACSSDDVEVQVVVLDSESDDGSWEALVAHYADDVRVELYQNRRGSGMVRSWIDGARYASGDFATFLWSDDWVFPNFATDLLPSLLRGTVSSRGVALIRDVNESTPPPATRAAAADTVSRAWAIAERYDALGWRVAAPPVSTACALFRADVMREWIGSVEELTSGNELRRLLMWQRGFGPDAYVYLLALERNEATIGHVTVPVAQFSSHEDSITVATSSWISSVAHWLTLCTVLERGRIQERLSARQLGAIYGAQVVRGSSYLLRRTPAEIRAKLDNADARRWISREVAHLWRDARGRIGTGVLVWGVLRALRDQAMRRISRHGKS